MKSLFIALTIFLSLSQSSASTVELGKVDGKPLYAFQCTVNLEERNSKSTIPYLHNKTVVIAAFDNNHAQEQIANRLTVFDGGKLYYEYDKNSSIVDLYISATCL